MKPNIPQSYLDSTEVNSGGIFNFADNIFDASRINAILRLVSGKWGGGNCDSSWRV